MKFAINFIVNISNIKNIKNYIAKKVKKQLNAYIQKRNFMRKHFPLHKFIDEKFNSYVRNKNQKKNVNIIKII